MKKILGLALLLISVTSFGQTFELLSYQDFYRANIGETVKANVQFRNNTERNITIVIRKIDEQIGGTQKSYFCIDGNCADKGSTEIRINPSETYNLLQLALDAGLANGQSSVRYQAYNKVNPQESLEFELNFSIEEKRPSAVYSSSAIILEDVYPNPVSDVAYINYKILNDRVKAKIVIHNILGNSIEEYALESFENKVKIAGDRLNSGIYFYTLYLDSDGVVTRKLIVKK